MSRPRSFDIDSALDAATKVFWAHGFEGTSMAMLCDAMEITKPSLYAAFGSKEDLFRQVIRRYHTGPAAEIGEAIDAPTVRDVFRGALAAAVRLHTGKGRPHGCLAITSVLSCKDPELRRCILEDRVAGREALRRRFRKAIKDGELRADCDVDLLAQYLQVAIAGIAVEAAIGAKRSRLREIADLSVRALDSQLVPR